MSRTWTIACILLLTSCTAARMGARLQVAVQAEKQIRTISTDAPFEVTMGRNYLKKAWEEAGHGEHGRSVELADQAVVWFDAAKKKADDVLLERAARDLPDGPELRERGTLPDVPMTRPESVPAEPMQR